MIVLYQDNIEEFAPEMWNCASVLVTSTWQSKSFIWQTRNNDYLLDEYLQMEVEGLSDQDQCRC